MKRKRTIISLLVLAVLLASLLFFRYPFLSAQADRSDPALDTLIKTEWLNAQTIIIRFGSDAVTAVKTQKGLVVIDAGISIGLTSRYRKVIEGEFQRNDFKYVINTHGHIDHCAGNGVFAEAVIIAQENSLQEMAAQMKDQEKAKSNLLKIVNNYDKQLQTLMPGTVEWYEVFCQKTRYRYAYEDVLNGRTPAEPGLTFSDCLSIDMGDATFDIVFFGKAHSESDVLIHIPEKKILMTGDLFSKYGRPGISDDKRQDIDRWLKVVEWMKARLPEIEIIIGGHGQILSTDDMQSFIAFVEKTAEK